MPIINTINASPLAAPNSATNALNSSFGNVSASMNNQGIDKSAISDI